MKTIFIDGKNFDVPDEVSKKLDDMFFSGEGLILDLCHVLDLDYTVSGKDEILAAISELKRASTRYEDGIFNKAQK